VSSSSIVLLFTDNAASAVIMLQMFIAVINEVGFFAIEADIFTDMLVFVEF
jgi:hypothetical protein